MVKTINTKNGQQILYKGIWISVRGGAWNDVMNSCMYVVIDDDYYGYKICIDKDAVVFAL